MSATIPKNKHQATNLSLSYHLSATATATLYIISHDHGKLVIPEYHHVKLQS
jgi:hypothetical protein